MKFSEKIEKLEKLIVALFTRAWIEMLSFALTLHKNSVALFTRAWIEIACVCAYVEKCYVALFTRAWIEISLCLSGSGLFLRRPLHEGVD